SSSAHRPMKKYFLLCVTHGESTRMLTDVEAEDLHAMLKGFYKVWSKGAVPAVKLDELTQADIDTLIFSLGALVSGSDRKIVGCARRVAAKIDARLESHPLLAEHDGN